MNYNDRVYEKLSAEYDQFIDSMKQMPFDKLITHAYEKVFKEEILTCFECGSMNLTPKEAKALLAKKEPLDYLYKNWLDTDCSYLDMLRDSIDSGVELLEKQARQKSSYER